MYAYLSLFMGWWNFQEIWIQTYFGPVTVASVEGFRILHFVATEPELPLFLLHLRTEAHPLSP